VTTAATDGRLLRGIRTRGRIVQSLLNLITDGVRSPTAAEIAERAGVSVRSVFQHFEDLEALYDDLVEEQSARVAPLVLSLRTGGDIERRIDALVDQRRVLFETITPVRRAIAGRTDASPAVRARVADLDAELRAQVKEQFRRELDERPEVIEAVDLLASFEGWDRLRTTQQLDSARAAAALRGALTLLLH
jgi:AcrR family transcriptional regulator